MLWLMLPMSCWTLSVWKDEDKDPGFHMGQLRERLACHHDD